MKYIFIALFIIVLIYTAIQQLKPTQIKPIKIQKRAFATQGVKKVKKGKTIQHNNQAYIYHYSVIKNPSNILLIENKQKKPLKQLAKKYSCKIVINGGFYDKNSRPLGLFIPDIGTTSADIKSNFLNAYFTISNKQVPNISTLAPTREDVRIALQSGPLLINNSVPLTLTITNDEYARRSAIAITKYKLTVFIIIYSQNSPFEGPLLKELPFIINKISNKESLHIIQALNLDGGSTSAFINETNYIQEFKDSISALCVVNK